LKATANAGSNIAFIKYWGVRQDRAGNRQALNPSVSMTLGHARTTTTVAWVPGLRADDLLINGRIPGPEARERIGRVLQKVRELAGTRSFARVVSVNRLPTSAGVASSASGFCALAMAASRAAGLSCEPADLVPLAILGSGSACRSLYGGFVLWRPPENSADQSVAERPEPGRGVQGSHGNDHDPGAGIAAEAPASDSLHARVEIGGDQGKRVLVMPSLAHAVHGSPGSDHGPGMSLAEQPHAAPDTSVWSRSDGAGSGSTAAENERRKGCGEVGGVLSSADADCRITVQRERETCENAGGSPDRADAACPADDGRSTVRQLATEDDWRLADLVVMVSREHKAVSSAQGHLLAATSPLLPGRLASLEARTPQVLRAVRDLDLPALGEAMEADALSMHAVMMTSTPPLLYWEPATIAVMRKVWELRARAGLGCHFTIDAGPNVHVIAAPEEAEAVRRGLAEVPGVLEILPLETGPGPFLTDEHLF